MIVPEFVWIAVAISVLILSSCVGAAILIKSSRRVVRRPVEKTLIDELPMETNPEATGFDLSHQLLELRRTRFGVPMVRHDIDNLGETVDGPHRRTPNIRRLSSDRRYYKRRHDPDLTGRREPGYRPNRQDKKEQ